MSKYDRLKLKLAFIFWCLGIVTWIGASIGFLIFADLGAFLLGFVIGGVVAGGTTFSIYDSMKDEITIYLNEKE